VTARDNYISQTALTVTNIICDLPAHNLRKILHELTSKKRNCINCQN